MADEVVRLVTEIDTAQPVQGAAAIDDAFRRTGASVGESMKKAGAEAAQAGKAAEGAFHGASGGAMRFHTSSREARVAVVQMAGAFAALSGVAEGAGEKMAAVSHVVSAAFTGNPVLIAVVAAAEGIKLLAGSMREAEERVQKMRDAVVQAGDAMESAFRGRALQAEQYGKSAETLMEQQREALQTEAEFLKQMADPSTNLRELMEQTNAARERANALDRVGTAEAKKRADELREQVKLVQDYRDVLAKQMRAEKDQPFLSKFAETFGWKREGEWKANLTKAAADALAAVQAAGKAGVGANAAEQTEVNDRLRIANLQRIFDLKAAQFDMDQKIAAAEAIFAGHDAVLVEDMGKIEALSRQIALLKQKGGEEDLKRVAILEREIAAVQQHASWWRTHGPEVQEERIRKIGGQWTAVDEITRLKSEWRSLLHDLGQYAGLAEEILGPIQKERIRLAEARRAMATAGTLGSARDEAARMLAGAGGWNTDVLAASQRLEALERQRSILAAARTELASEELRKMDEQITAQKVILDATRQTVALRADRSLSREIEMMRAYSDEQRAQVELLQRIEDLQKGGASASLIAQYTLLKQREPIIAFVRQVQQTLESGIVDALMDGFTNGGRNAAEILRNVLNSLLRETLSNLVHGLLGSVFGGLFGGGGGAASFLPALAGGCGPEG